jgi:acetyl esterase/lipase
VDKDRLTRVRTLAIDYWPAPEHPMPAALEDALAGYRFLLDQGFAAAQRIGPGADAS